MIFDHAVKHNGIIYKAGADVPVDGSVSDTEKNTNENIDLLKSAHEELMANFAEVEKLASDRAEEISSLKEENEQLKEENAQLSLLIPQKDDEKPSYSKSDISRMNVAGLKELAPTLGIEVTEESTGEELKKQIIEKLAL